MIDERGSSSRGRWAVALTALVAAVAVLLWLERGSLERGNRLFHAGQGAAAEQIFRERAERGRASPADAYNLGTVLLSLSPQEAEEVLRTSAAGADSAAAHRSHYNLAYLYLARATGTQDPEQAIPLLRSSVADGRLALRLDPSSDNTRWNLALAQRMLDSLTAPQPEASFRTSAGEDEIRIDDLSMTRSDTGEGASGLEPETPQPGEAAGRRQAAQVGARESWTTQDPGPLSDSAARVLLAAQNDDPEELIRGILWSHRPGVAWWSGEAYPGGAW
jgi:hypothetical protein